MLQTVIDHLARGYWLPKLRGLRALLEQNALTRKQADSLITDAIAEVKKHHNGRALNYVSLAFVSDQQLATASARKRGIFRATTYNLDHRIPQFIVVELLANRTVLSLNEATVAYLRSCQALLKAASHFRDAREHLRQELRASPQTLLHGALAAVDYAYLTGDTVSTGISPEDLAE
jgi:hypothetical protein